jgi:hypothetical protein
MQHVMTMTRSDSSGPEFWECGECGRTLLVAWDPFRRDVLIRGDDSVVHTGGKGGLRMTGVEAISSSP